MSVVIKRLEKSNVCIERSNQTIAFETINLVLPYICTYASENEKYGGIAMAKALAGSVNITERKRGKYAPQY